MVKVRQDAWSHEDDLLLAETVLRHIREGSTQLRAFDEVGDQLNRTSAACGFRWNAEVRQKYNQAIDIAKRQRKEKKRALATTQPKPARVAMGVQSTLQIEEEEELPTVQMQESTPVQRPVATMQQDTESVSFEQVIRYMRDLKQQYQASNQSKSKVTTLEKENESLRYENDQLQRKINQMEKQYNTIQEDYQVLMQIMDRARKMIVFDEEEQKIPTPAFRMEKNGNLEQVAR